MLRNLSQLKGLFKSDKNLIVFWKLLKIISFVKINIMNNTFRNFFKIALLIFVLPLSNCKKEEPEPLALGQNYQGGIIVFLDDTGEHGLIAATTDQHTNIAWCPGSCSVTNSTATAPGSGKPNTDAIVAVQKSGNYAAYICEQLVHNGYDDWFLPSKDELNMLFVQSEAGRIGNFLPEEYWSSTEDDKDRAWQQHMDNGGAGAEIKVNKACVRAMRAF